MVLPRRTLKTRKLSGSDTVVRNWCRYFADQMRYSDVRNIEKVLSEEITEFPGATATISLARRHSRGTVTGPQDPVKRA